VPRNRTGALAPVGAHIAEAGSTLCVLPNNGFEWDRRTDGPPDVVEEVRGRTADELFDLRVAAVAREASHRPSYSVDNVVAGSEGSAPAGRTLTTFQLLLSVFGVIFVAELPDKTALAALVLATHYAPLPVFAGAAAALTAQSAVAVAAGGLLSLLPSRAVHCGAGLLFLISAIVMWTRTGGGGSDHWKVQQSSQARSSFRHAFGTVFVVVFVAEWGDLTQLGTAALAAHYRDPLVVFVGATLALWAVAALAVLVGNRAGKLLDPDRTKKVAAVIFALVGVLLLVGIV
jgi:Ca2+/H+ antiporter, TMEM165/GDT1 family